MSTRYRYYGVTDDVIQCEQCGKADLKATVILEVLDADGNPVDVTYYGSSCAARALSEWTGRKHTGAQVLNAAKGALTATLNRMRSAQQLVDYYADVEDDTAALVERVRDAHRAHWKMADYSDARWLVEARTMIARNRKIVAEGQAALHPAAA